MEQRDAIVKNLREISHFFLSENKQNEPHHLPEEDKPKKAEKKSALAPNVSYSPKPENISHLHNPNTLHDAKPLPNIYYTVSQGLSAPVMGALCTVSFELAAMGHRSSIVGSRDAVEKMTADFLKAHAGIHRHCEPLADDHDCSLTYLSNGATEFPLTVIGRTHFDSGAQLERYMHDVQSVFITDFPLSHIKERVHDNRPVQLLCFTRPNPEDAFKLYTDLRDLALANRRLWCGIVVVDAPTIPEALRVYTSIAQTLDKYTGFKPHYLGYTSRSANSTVPGMNRLSRIPSKKSSQAVAKHFTRSLPQK